MGQLLVHMCINSTGQRPQAVRPPFEINTGAGIVHDWDAWEAGMRVPELSMLS